MTRDWHTVIIYLATLAVAGYLTATGKLPSDVLSALLAVGIPSPFMKRNDP